jgi:tRNA G18 (ribose-2'-O)-methylase SpoU
LRAKAEMTNIGGNIIPEKVAIVFGTEAVGCTNEMLNAADLRVYLPLRGFADSLNLSVATALVVHQMFILDPSLI